MLVCSQLYQLEAASDISDRYHSFAFRSVCMVCMCICMFTCVSVHMWVGVAVDMNISVAIFIVLYLNTFKIGVCVCLCVCAGAWACVSWNGWVWRSDHSIWQWVLLPLLPRRFQRSNSEIQAWWSRPLPGNVASVALQFFMWLSLTNWDSLACHPVWESSWALK